MCRDAAPDCRRTHATATKISECVSAEEHATYVIHNFISLSSDVSYAVTELYFACRVSTHIVENLYQVSCAVSPCSDSRVALIRYPEVHGGARTHLDRLANGGTSISCPGQQTECVEETQQLRTCAMDHPNCSHAQSRFQHILPTDR